MEPRACTKCGGPIDDPVDAGRPRAYCSTACRRAAEHEIRRLNTLLGKLEEKASHARLGYGASSAKHIQELAAEIALQETRLKLLLEGD